MASALCWPLLGCHPGAFFGSYPDQPTACFGSTPDPSNPLVVTFDASKAADGCASKAASGLQITSYNWDFGDGHTEEHSDDKNNKASLATHAYGTRGHYYVTLTVRDDDLATALGAPSVVVGVTAIAAHYVVVGNHKPVAHLVATPSIVASGGSVMFDRSGSVDSDGTIQGWTLDFGDGSALFKSEDPNETRVPHAYESAKPTPYGAVLTVWDNDGEASTPVPAPVDVRESLQCTVTIVAPPPGTTVPRSSDVPISVHTAGDLQVTTVDFYVDQSGPYPQTIPPFTFHWDTTDARIISTGAHVITAQGLVTDRSTQACRGFDTVTLNVPPP